MKLPQKMDQYRSRMQLLALLAVGCAIILFDTLNYVYPELETFLEKIYFVLPCVLFLCSALTRPLTIRAKQGMVLGVIAIAWFAAVQGQHQLWEMGTDSLSLFAVSYLMAFPFASVTEEDVRKTGMKWLGKCYMAGTLLLVLCTVLLQLELVPQWLSGRVLWDGTRLTALWHPNAAACLFMIGIGFTLYFLLRAETGGKQLLFALLAVIEFLGMALTNGRTSIFLACMLFGGTIFFLLRRTSRRHYLVDAAVAAVLMMALFSFSRVLFDLHSDRLTSRLERQEAVQEEITAQAEIPAPVFEKSNASAPPETSPSAPAADEARQDPRNPAQSTQKSLKEDIWTLNKRTYTWKAALSALRDNPDIRIWGTKYVSTEISYRNAFSVAHAHNSWIQTMMETGLPGLLIALVYTAIALTRSIRLLVSRQADSCKRLLALLVLCIMLAGFLEPFLFVGGLSTAFANFAFFFLTGYLDHWYLEMQAEKQ